MSYIRLTTKFLELMASIQFANKTPYVKGIHNVHKETCFFFRMNEINLPKYAVLPNINLSTKTIYHMKIRIIRTVVIIIIEKT